MHENQIKATQRGDGKVFFSARLVSAEKGTAAVVGSTPPTSPIERNALVHKTEFSAEHKSKKRAPKREIEKQPHHIQVNLNFWLR